MKENLKKKGRKISIISSLNPGKKERNNIHHDSLFEGEKKIHL